MMRRRDSRRKKERIVTGPCYFCKGKIEPDYKEPGILRRFTSQRGRILASVRSGVCAKHQRALKSEIKRARFLAYLQFAAKQR